MKRPHWLTRDYWPGTVLEWVLLGLVMFIIAYSFGIGMLAGYTLYQAMHNG